MTTYTNPLTGHSEQITDSRALTTKEERIAAAAAEQAAFERQSSRPITWPAKRYGCPCAQCRHS